MKDTEEEKQILFDKRLREVEDAQDSNILERRQIEQTKDLLAEDDLRSKAWIEDFERCASAGTREQRLVEELWENHRDTVTKNEVGLERVLEDNLRESKRLDDKRDALILERRKASTCNSPAL
ncbi:MAG: hypothetical protein FWE41_03410 [Coriobacteriia bacterium]|nr:hypothetical protein [Coriobacteriia bacterium]MCL2749707.1 hypothetical protein [Coriobacteriia bacterium]